MLAPMGSCAGFLRTVGRCLRQRPAAPVPSLFWAAGLSFARSSWMQVGKPLRAAPYVLTAPAGISLWRPCFRASRPPPLHCTLGRPVIAAMPLAPLSLPPRTAGGSAILQHLFSG